MLNDALPQLAALAGVVLLACISPGPDFVAVTSHALGGRRGGLGVALGVATACLAWAAVAMAGFGLVLARVAWAYEVIRLSGALYLVWLGGRMLVGALRPAGKLEVAATASVGFGTGYRRGLMVNLTNPKAAAFFGSLFVSVLPQDAGIEVLAAALAVVGGVAALWFSALALAFSAAPVRRIHARARRGLDAAMGAVLVALGARMAVS